MLWPLADLSWPWGEQLKCKQISRVYIQSNVQYSQTYYRLTLTISSDHCHCQSDILHSNHQWWKVREAGDAPKPVTLLLKLHVVVVFSSICLVLVVRLSAQHYINEIYHPYIFWKKIFYILLIHILVLRSEMRYEQCVKDSIVTIMSAFIIIFFYFCDNSTITYKWQ